MRDDGQRLLGGCLPTLIEWGKGHPVDALPASGVVLRQLAVQHPQQIALQAWAHEIGLMGIAWTPGPAALLAAFDTPQGPRTLRSLA